MQRINQDIQSGQFKPVYLLYGEETYLVNQYKNKLRKALGSEEDQMNNHRYQGKDTSIGEIIDLAETLPFLAERRVIVLEDTGWFKSGGEQMAEYLANQNETTVFLFVESEIDKRSKLFKTISNQGVVVEFAKQDEATLRRWIKTMISKEGKNASDMTIQLLVSKTGTDMENIYGEVQKLICYCLDKDTIEEQDVEAVCVTRIANHVFDMVDAIAVKNQRRAMEHYYDLMALKEPPMRILFLIARQCNILMQVKEMLKNGTPQKNMASTLGVPPFAVKKYVSQAEKFTSSQLRRAIARCVEAEEDVKTGRMNDVLCLEVLIMTVFDENGKKKK